MTDSHRPRWGVVALVCASISGFAVSSAAASTSDREMHLTFDDAALRTNAGASSLEVREVTSDGGTLRKVEGRTGTAIRTPAYEAGGDAPKAVLTVVQKDNDLSPGTASFSFGADFTLNASSEGSRSDNGNNLVQRGLYDAPMQYKLQVDDGKPSCRVRGTQGSVSVASSREVENGEWYRAVCVRRDSKVTLRVTRLSNGATWSYSRSGDIGSLQAPASLPLSVAGKVNASGALVSASDQFNGRIDNAFFACS